jgi:uncharacterized protein (TIGR02646 family)
VIFTDYKQAAPYLKERLGRYCSYCERWIAVSLAVEHVSPKSKNLAHQLDWNNFLVACGNCNSTKGDQVADCLWPDLHDTFHALIYRESGAVKPANPEDARATAILRLVGLDKKPDSISAEDHRFDDRYEAWGKAERAKQLIAKTPLARASATDTVTGHGHWPIWMTVFADDADMQQRLIAAFPGTAKARLGIA